VVSLIRLNRISITSRQVLALGAVYVIWSSTYLAMRIVVRDMAPLTMAAIRFAVAGGVLLMVALHRGARVPALRDWLRIAPVGALLFLGGNGFVAIAEQSVSSGGAAVVCATMPLWAGVLRRLLGERVTLLEWGSLSLGFVGVLVLMGGPSLEGPPVHIVLVCLSPAMWALGSLWARRTKDVGGAHATLVGPALQMLTGAVVLAVGAALRSEPLPTNASLESWLALAYLFAFGSVVAFTAYSWLLRHARPIVATSYAYVNPVLAVLIGAFLYNEALGWTTAVANVLIVAAVVLALRGPRYQPPESMELVEERTAPEKDHAGAIQITQAERIG
jgi:drug/metabolite transporter (DMT)-like permease